MMIDLSTATHDAFEPYLHQRFVVSVDGAAVLEIELVAVEPLGPAAPPSGGRRPFSLLFRGPAEPALDQGTFTLTGVGGESFDLFLVPVAPDARGRRYEAIIA